MKRTANRALIAVIIVSIHFFLLQVDEVHQHPGDNSASFSSSFITSTTTASIHGFTNPSSSGPYGRIAFQLHNRHDDRVNSAGEYDPVPSHACRDTADLPSTLAKNEVLGFKASISTDLNIIFIGDSVASQLAQAFDASVLETRHDYNRNSIKRYFTNGRDQVKHICVTQSTIRGGGVSAYMRHNFMISKSSMRQHGVCGHGEKFWGVDVAYSMLDYKKEANSSQEKVGSFNAAILKLPAIGWIRNIHSITKEAIVEEINLVGKYFGAETVILSTITFNNNVKTLDDWEGIQKVNDIMREIARNWVVPQPDTLATPNAVRRVLVQELYYLTNEMIWMNAHHMGYNVSIDFSAHNWDRGEMNVNFLFDRFEQTSRYFWPPSIPMVCDQKTLTNNGTECRKNRISPDGMHWCTDTIGPRYSASIACLLGCVYNGDSAYLIEVEDTTESATIRICEEECNRRFMSLAPVNHAWIHDGETLYSQINSSSI